MKHPVMRVVAALMVCLFVVPSFGADEPNQPPMNPEVQKLMDRLAADIDKLAVALPENATDAEKSKLTEEFAMLKTFTKGVLLPLCVNKVFVQEVAAQNAKGVSLADIQAIDKQWMEAEDELPIQAEKMNNACALEIKKIAKTLPILGETFVMDNQGANVGQNALTSDYWQGDEAKWKESYKDGKGGVDFGKRQLDKSTNVVDQKISLPVIDEQGKVIGAVCFGVKVELLAQTPMASNAGK
ncbi:MAG TPA: hypothetical protein PLT20_00200 [Sedimentisphaerales bacterium]|nr:hypothetical protein [Phycisphaerae bacterium]HON90898.1 hypothetical protein [Sedimentisphaerales bacterium]HQI26473.1 hypothetical protein [Sedimentisphaerales bacterium]